MTAKSSIMSGISAARTYTSVLIQVPWTNGLKAASIGTQSAIRGMVHAIHQRRLMIRTMMTALRNLRLTEKMRLYKKSRLNLANPVGLGAKTVPT